MAWVAETWVKSGGRKRLKSSDPRLDCGRSCAWGCLEGSSPQGESSDCPYFTEEESEAERSNLSKGTEPVEPGSNPACSSRSQIFTPPVRWLRRDSGVGDGRKSVTV